jgi:hypothetical protein
LHSISIPSGGITTFGPLILKNFGFDKYTAILLNMPLGAIQIIATMGGAAIATWTKRKGPALALLCIPPIAGTIILLIIPVSVSTRGALLAGYYLISFYPGICKSSPACILDLPSNVGFSPSDLFLVCTKHCR